jgi:CD2 antigen cytoplasmic tail-binding protein 2
MHGRPLPGPTPPPHPPILQAVTTKRGHKGKTLAEIEEEEGGPVKESLVGMAHVKRAQRRRAGDAAGGGLGGTDIPDDIAAAEEHGTEEEEEGGSTMGAEGAGGAPGGARGKKGAAAAAAAAAAELPGGDAAPLTAFNLDEERQEGHFDEEGNYVFDKGDPEDREDEWLRSEEGEGAAQVGVAAGTRLGLGIGDRLE